MTQLKIHFSDFFEVSPQIIEDHGAFNISMINDLPLFIDPFLLFNSTKPEYQKLHQEIIAYVRFIRDHSQPLGISKGLLAHWFQFPEVKQNWLGYSKKGNGGTGLGPDFAESLNINLHNIFTNFGNEEITKSSHLEKLCLIKDGIGRDNISDFTTNLIKEYLLQYTQDFATRHIRSDLRKKLMVERVRFNYQTETWQSHVFDIPYYSNDYILLTPKDILTKDNTWINKNDLIKDFDDIRDSIANEELRAQINNYFLKFLPEKHNKKQWQSAATITVNKFPDIIDYYIKYKEDRGEEAQEISDKKVAEIQTLFIDQLTRFVGIVREKSFFYNKQDDTYEQTYDRVIFLKNVIEDQDGYRFFYIKGKAIKREADLQLLFRLTWYATPLDVNREVNNGRGPVDYKISRGSKDKTLVEFKLASNTSLKKNLEKQVAIYEKANDTNKSIKVILYFSKPELKKVQKILKDLDILEDRNIILIDACNDNKPSGSVA